MRAISRRLTAEEGGQGMAEYGLILALVALALIGALVLFGQKLQALFNSFGDTIDSAVFTDAG